MEREFDLDAALERLARSEAEAAPEPSDDLMARVLADAAAVAPVAAAAAAAEPAMRRTGRPVARRVAGQVEIRRGRWFSGAVMALSISLTVGIGAGYAGVDLGGDAEKEQAEGRGFDGTPF